jgi:transposase
MDQRRHRRRPLHGVREPGMQQELRGFAHRTHEQQQADDGQCVGIEAEIMEALADQVRSLSKNRIEIDRAGQHKDRKYPECEPEIADAVDDERFNRGRISLRFVEPEADEQITR